jgi:hypothetical protein
MRRATLGLMLLSACADGSITASGEKLDGSIVVSATVDGRPWVADSGTRGAAVYAVGGAEAVSITGSRRFGGGAFVEALNVYVDSFAVGRPVPIQRNGALLSQRIQPAPASGPVTNFFIVDTAGTGVLVVDGYDPVNRLVSGHFNFRARIVVRTDTTGNVLGDSVITVTDGKFRLPYNDRFSH